MYSIEMESDRDAQCGNGYCDGSAIVQKCCSEVESQVTSGKDILFAANPCESAIRSCATPCVYHTYRDGKVMVVRQFLSKAEKFDEIQRLSVLFGKVGGGAHTLSDDF
jgi:hypothetical protein